MNVQSNLYTLIYATILVVVVAVGLSLTSILLKDRQSENVEKEKKQNILASIGVDCSRDEAVILFEEYVIDMYAVDYEGNKIEGADAFNIELSVEQRKDLEEQQFPIYECDKDGEKIFVFPLWGKGLWGPIWGYVALEADFNTIAGVNFDHKSETPGLGAEIRTNDFQSQFIGKKLFVETGKFVSVLVRKPSEYNPQNPHEVQGLTGSTITCNGLEDMLKNSLKPYENFFKAQ